MAKDFERMEDSNRSANPSIHEISDPSRRVVLLGGGMTPWGTYLGAEEQSALHFDGPDERDADQRRRGLLRTGRSRWGRHDPRFDAMRHPDAFHRLAWIVGSTPSTGPARRSSASCTAAVAIRRTNGGPIGV